MGIVSARIDDADEKVLKAAKVNLSRIARDALHKEAQRLVRLEAFRRLQELGKRAKPSVTTSEQIVRELRDDD